MQDYIDYLVAWLKTEVQNAGCKGVICGLSGGIDSAVVSLLMQKAFNEEHLTVIMPIASSKSSTDDALNHTIKHNLKTITFDLTDEYTLLSSKLEITNTLAFANMKARLRMITLYALAQEHGYLVIGTDNACEWHTGYFTKFGDGGVDLVPLKHLLKSDVYEMGRILGVDESILSKAPTADLWSNQTDEEELQVTYAQLDSYLLGEEIEQSAKARIEHLHAISMHKRTVATAPEKQFRKLVNIY